MDLKSFNDEELRQALNLETGQIGWNELQRQFAGGRIIVIAPDIDLVNVAIKFVRDSANDIEELINQNKIAPATDDDARQWNESQASFWSVVVAPWVLVQPINSENPHSNLTH